MRINPEVKQRMENIYARQGLSFTDAVNIFIQQSLNTVSYTHLLPTADSVKRSCAIHTASPALGSSNYGLSLIHI